MCGRMEEGMGVRVRTKFIWNLEECFPMFWKAIIALFAAGLTFVKGIGDRLFVFEMQLSQTTHRKKVESYFAVKE